MRERRHLILIAALAAVSAPVHGEPSTSPASMPPAEKMICKTHVETGSLVSRKRRCYTKSQWKYVNEQNEYYAQKMMLDNMGKSPGF